MPRKSKGRGRGRGRGSSEANNSQVGQNKPKAVSDEPKRPGFVNEEKKTLVEEKPAQLHDAVNQAGVSDAQINELERDAPSKISIHDNCHVQPEGRQSSQQSRQQKQGKGRHKRKQLNQEVEDVTFAPSGATQAQQSAYNQRSVENEIRQRPEGAICATNTPASTSTPQAPKASGHNQRSAQSEGHQRAKQGNQLNSEIAGASNTLPTTSTPQAPKVSGHNQRSAQSEGHQRAKQGNQLNSEIAGASNTPPSTSTPQAPKVSGRNQRSAQNGRQVIASAVSEEKPSHLKQQVYDLPRRPGYGDQGRKIRLKANFFKLDFRGVDFLYHYDIDIKPERTPVSECRKVVNAAINKYLRQYFDNHKPAFDGKKNLYSRKKLPSINGDGVELDVTLMGDDGGKERHFKLTVKYAAEVRVTDLHQFLSGKSKAVPDAVQGLDIVLRQIPSLYFTPIGRSFFPPNKPGSPLGGGCEVKTGFYQTIRPSEWKTMLVNIDVSSKGFMKAQPVIDLLCDIAKANDRTISDRQWRMKHYQEKEFVEAVKGFKVETNHIPGKKRKYLVNGIGKNAFDYKFKLESESRMISVKEYFKEMYNIDLRFPHLPCLVVGQKKNYLPMEVCQMVESQKRKLTDDQTAAMIKKVTCPAKRRQKDIEEWASQLQGNSAQYLHDEYGMSINKNMVDVEGRVLDPPRVSLGGKGTIVPHNGVWDMRNKMFFQGTSIDVWAMVCFVDQRRCGQEATRKFANVMSKVCRDEGMSMNGRPCHIQYPRTNDNIEQILSNLIERYKDLQLVLVVLPAQGNKDVYKEVKRVADTVLGIPTQCVQTKQFEQAKPQVCSNIAMKINAKLGGINHIVDPSDMPPVFQEVIVFGADVTHPSPGESNIPSIAAVVASVDPHASKYAARVRAQTHMKDKAAQEIILEMKAMVKELLIEFYKATRKKPQRIIFYRDGVSEGQFDQVLIHEVKAVQQACLELPGEYRPPITFIVVQKRHHARLFCTDRADESGKSGNIPPGTMVDRGITHPYEFDFYLCSHQGIQGTSRPTHYHVLYDDNSFDANSLQKLTYHLCHTYARCTRSVSMPSPAYYAHLVAFRARHHLNGLASKRHEDGKSDEEVRNEWCKAINVNEKLKKAMYFA